MSIRVWFGMAVLAGAAAVTAQAQFSGFASASYGYHAAPLYNYERIPDHLRQGYAELQYTHAAGDGMIAAGYTGGVMIFQTFTDRNYLEHALRLSYQNAYGTPRTAQHRPAILPPTGDQDGGEDVEEEEEEEAPPVDPDSTRTFLDLQLRASARHDKDAFREFDNTGLTLIGVLRLPLGSWFLRITNECGLRSYQNITELSNLSDYATVQFGRHWGAGFNAGIALAGGSKYYTTDMYDTTQFESTRTYVEKASGKGKGGAKLVVPSDKQILTNATTTISWQTAGGVFAGYTWDGGAVAADGWYRYNPGKATRYLAQYANTSMLNEDIYNDFFSYAGPESHLVYRQSLPFGLQSTITGTVARRQYEAPALDLEGNDLGKKRRDVVGLVELWLSRSLPLSEGFGLEVALSGALLRNRSNDAYNDFGSYQAGVSLGIAF